METVQSLLEKKSIYYRASGKDYTVSCFNPEHEDTNPSMRIDKLTGVFNCLSCGFAGNVFHTYGETRNEIDIRVRSLKDKVKDMLRASIYIPLGAEPFDRDFRGIKAKTYTDFGVFTYRGDIEGKDVDARVIIPVSDIHGSVRFFVARNIYSELDPKYIITPSDSKMLLYPPKVDKDANSIILVEGIFDMLNLWDKGLKNAVCTFGTAFGNTKNRKNIEENMAKLSQYKIQGISKIYIMYDGDTAGNISANRLYENIKDKFNAEVIELPDGLDPGKMTLEDVNSLRGLIHY